MLEEVPELVGNEGAGERPSKHQRLLAVFEHEDDTHASFFEESEIIGRGVYDYSLECERDEKMHETSHIPETSNDVETVDSAVLHFDLISLLMSF